MGGGQHLHLNGLHTAQCNADHVGGKERHDAAKTFGAEFAGGDEPGCLRHLGRQDGAGGTRVTCARSSPADLEPLTLETLT